VGNRIIITVDPLYRPSVADRRGVRPSEEACTPHTATHPMNMSQQVPLSMGTVRNVEVETPLGSHHSFRTATHPIVYKSPRNAILKLISYFNLSSRENSHVKFISSSFLQSYIDTFI